MRLQWQLALSGTMALMASLSGPAPVRPGLRILAPPLTPGLVFFSTHNSSDPWVSKVAKPTVVETGCFS